MSPEIVLSMKRLAFSTLASSHRAGEPFESYLVSMLLLLVASEIFCVCEGIAATRKFALEVSLMAPLVASVGKVSLSVSSTYRELQASRSYLRRLRSVKVC